MEEVIKTLQQNIEIAKDCLEQKEEREEKDNEFFKLQGMMLGYNFAIKLLKEKKTE